MQLLAGSLKAGYGLLQGIDTVVKETSPPMSTEFARVLTEARLGIAWTEGVVKRGMSLSRFADITATNAARIFGLYPRKGAIAPGSDADIVLIDPSVRRTLTRDDFHVTDYSPWEGWTVSGWPVLTMLRGTVIVEHGRLLGSPLDGRLLARKIHGAVLARPAC